MDSIKYVLIAMLRTAKKKKEENAKAFPYQGQQLHCKTIKMVVNQLNSLVFNDYKAQESTV